MEEKIISKQEVAKTQQKRAELQKVAEKNKAGSHCTLDERHCLLFTGRISVPG